MKIRTFVVLCGAIGLGATLGVSAQQVELTQYKLEPDQAGSGVFVRYEGKIVKGQPYSADIVNESIQSLSDGNRIVQRTTSRVFRDVEGRIRREEDRPNGTPAITISDPVLNKSWTLNTEAKTARETPNMGIVNLMADLRGIMINPVERKVTGSVEVQGGGGGGARGGRGVGTGAGAGAAAGGGGGRGGAVASAPTERQIPKIAAVGGGARGGGGLVGRRDNRVEEQLPNKSIENLLCTGVRRTTTIEKGAIGNEQPIKIVSEEWTSIDLQVLVLTELNDPRSGKTTYKLQNVRRGDPDLMLFKVPADYTITTAGGGGRGRGGR